jgi:hypothetical protein
MKIKGKMPDRPTPEICVIPRPSGEDIVFRARLIDYNRFKELVKTPQPPLVTKAGGVKTEDYTDATFVNAVSRFNTLRAAYMVIESLKETDGLEWETVKDDDPDTWPNYEQELLDAGLTQNEINHIMGAVMNANSMNESRFEEARERFLRTQEVVAPQG